MTENSPNASPAAPIEDGYCGDDWPLMLDGTEWNGQDLPRLVRDGRGPFGNLWDVLLLLEGVEIQVQVQVVDLPQLHTGSNKYVRTVLSCPGQRRLSRVLLLVDANYVNWDRGFPSNLPTNEM